jgi:hypothetical protein
MISWENEARAVAGGLGCDTPQRAAEQPGEIDAVLLVEFLQGTVGLRRLPDVAHDRHVDEHLIIAVGNATQGRMQVPGRLDHGEVAPDAVAADRVVAFRKRADDRGLVGKVLIERAERHAAARHDVAHAEGLAAFFSHQRGRACEDFFEPLAAALLALRAASIKISGNRDAARLFGSGGRTMPRWSRFNLSCRRT